MKRLLCLTISIALLAGLACSSPKTFLDIELGDAMSLANENIIAANDKYSGSDVRFVGEITDIDSDSIRIVPKSLMNLAKLSGAKCLFHADDELLAAELMPGQTVSVSGRVKKFTESFEVETMTVSDCRILGSE